MNILMTLAIALSITFAVAFAGVAVVAAADALNRCFPDLPPNDTCRGATVIRNTSALIATLSATLAAWLFIRRKQRGAVR